MTKVTWDTVKVITVSPLSLYKWAYYCKPRKVTVWFKTPSLEEPDNKLQREFCVHSPQIWLHIKKEVVKGGSCVSSWVVHTTLLNANNSSRHWNPYYGIKLYIAFLFYVYLPGRDLTAQTWKVHFYSLWAFLFLMDVTWLAWMTLLTFLPNCLMQQYFSFWLLNIV